MHHPAIVALTGAIGSGKSTAAGLFAELGVPVLDGDALARTIHQEPQHPATRALAQAFPHAIDANGQLRRGSLRDVFARDEQANARLKEILAPHVFAEARRWAALQQAPYVLVESALMLDFPGQAARLVVVDAREETRRARVASRNPDWTDADFAAVAAMQPPRATYIVRADDIVPNDGGIDALRVQVRRLHAALTRLYPASSF